MTIESSKIKTETEAASQEINLLAIIINSLGNAEIGNLATTKKCSDGSDSEIWIYDVDGNGKADNIIDGCDPQKKLLECDSRCSERFETALYLFKNVVPSVFANTKNWTLAPEYRSVPGFEDYSKDEKRTIFYTEDRALIAIVDLGDDGKADYIDLFFSGDDPHMPLWIVQMPAQLFEGANTMLRYIPINP